MKVKELIEQLQRLDPERNVWVFYDYPCDAFEASFGGIANHEDAAMLGCDGVKVGDYYMFAG
jgi:hypothetical protein